MKTTILHWHELLLTAALGLTVTGMAGAQTTTTTTVPKTKQVEAVKKPVKPVGIEGTLRSLGPDALVIQGPEGTKTLSYRYGKTIQYVDDDGNVVSRETLVPGVPVTVQYVREGDGLLANRVIVHHKVPGPVEPAASAPAPATTAPATTTTTSETTIAVTTEKKATAADGVLSRWEPDRFELATEKAGIVKFRYSQDTQFVDVDDKHVDIIRMKSGLPVTVRFKQVGDNLVATRIILNVRSNENVR